MVQEQPETITVFGAGMDVFNGQYQLSSEKDDNGFPLFYQKDCVWDGKPDKCVIARNPDLNNNTSFWLIKVASHEANTCYYFSNEAAPNIPPQRGWWQNFGKANVYEKERAPILIYGNDTAIEDWRQDPADSMSDFALEIVESPSSIKTTYHVHKIMLVKASEYFAALFRDKKRKRSNAKAKNKKGLETHRIEVPKEVAFAVSFLLDYFYGQFTNSGTVMTDPVRGERTVALYWLADYLQVPCLQQKLLQVIQRIDARHCSRAYASALALGFDFIVEQSVKIVSDRLLTLKFDDDKYYICRSLVKGSDAPFVLRVLQAKDMTAERSRKASEFVAAVSKKHPVTLEEFATMTDKTLLPHIDASAVWKLLKKERELLSAEQENNDEPLNPTVLSCLQERCIDALVHNFLQNKASAFEDASFRSQSSVFVLEYVARLNKRQQGH